ncbi:MAG: LysM peptidoglycan-binding domain-containing protein [Bacteroidales bacterium]|nr:LysM peptidoglycan-binding domain-containing protein [Bacteroidales bacterium]MDT8374279.1 LysM peptidoglycan-binding domain-containing protein [Bacteroidales bacterium]
MTATRILLMIALTVALLAPLKISAQVPVQVSNERVISGGRAFFMHEVLKGQTLYSISRAYKVTIDAITRENVIPASGIQTGQMLRIPISAAASGAASGTSSAAQPMPMPKPRPAAVTPSGTASSGIKISREKIVFNNREYYMHLVLKGQTLYSIAKAYKVTILDIDRENVIPASGIQAGQVLRIPVSSSLVVEDEAPAPPAASAGATQLPSAPETPARYAGKTQPLPVQEKPRAVPAQEKPRSGSQLPHQEQPEAESGKVTADTQAAKTDKPTAKEETPEPPGEVQAQEPAPKSEPEAAKPQPVKRRVHKVRKGESLSDIADKYGITVQELKKANKGVIFAMPDMRLVIPAPQESGQK